jgi:predicted dehydrogenase
MPESVSAAFGHLTGHAVEDNAAVVLRHRTGAIGIAETGFVNPHSPFAIEIHGTAGSLLFGSPEPRLLVSPTTDQEGPWSERPVPEDAPSPFEQWIGHIVDGTDATENVALALDLTTLVAAANRSAATGTAVALESAPDARADR